MRWERLLTALILEQTQRLFRALRRSLGLGDLEGAKGELREGYFRAHATGAKWTVLDLLGARRGLRARLEDLEKRIGELGIRVEFDDPEVIGRVEAQARAAGSLLEQAVRAGLPRAVGADARAAAYAVRWGVQQGIADVAEQARAETGGEEVELLKVWVRLAARVEHRAWHDALEGTAIPLSQKFELRGPKGVFLVDRPYDPALPLSEKVHCGHGIRVILPEEAQSIRLFSGHGNETLFVRRRKPPGLRVRLAKRLFEATPRGALVSTRYTGLEGEGFEVARRALGIVDRIHGLPYSVRQVRFRVNDEGAWLGGGDVAAYIPDLRQPGSPYGIFLNSDLDYDELDVIHEIGHDLDHNVLGDGVNYASETSDLLQAWREAALNSLTVTNQRRLFNADFYQGKPLDADELEELSWMLATREIFARSYAQWVGMNSADPELLEQLGRYVDREFRPVRVYTRTWPEEEFEPIAKALDELFRKLGWIE